MKRWEFAEIAKLWADGVPLQVEQSSSPHRWRNLLDDDLLSSNYRYRVKPKPLMWRAGKWMTSAGREVVSAYTDPGEAETDSRDPSFVGWLTEWREADL